MIGERNSIGDGSGRVEVFDFPCQVLGDDHVALGAHGTHAPGGMTKPDLVEGLTRRAGFELGEGLLLSIELCTQLTVEEGVERAKANSRKTVRPHDFIVH